LAETNNLEAWINALGSNHTKDVYRKIWANWWGWSWAKYASEGGVPNPTGYSPNDLITHRFAEVKLDPPGRFHCEDLVTEWHESLKQRGLSDGARRTYLAVIKSFFKYGTHGTGSLGLQIKIGRKRRREKYVPTQIDLLKLRRYCSPREWALIACCKDAGFGPDQLSHLMSKQITLLESDWWVLTGQREKTDEPFVTFWGPDATNAYRAAFGDPANYDPTKPAFSTELGTPHTSNSIRMAMWRAITRASMPKGLNPYALRAFFNSQLETAKVPDNWRKRAMGHSLGQVQGAYSHPQLADWLKTYKEAYRFLSVENGGSKPEGLSGEDVVELLMAFNRGDKETINKYLARFPQLSKYMTEKVGLGSGQ